MSPKEVLRKVGRILSLLFETAFILFVLAAIAVFWLIGGCMVLSVDAGQDPYVTHFIIGIIMMAATTEAFVALLARYWYAFRGNKQKVENYEYWLGTAVMNGVLGMMVMLPWFWIEKGEPHLGGDTFLIYMAVFMTILWLSMLIGSLLKKPWADWRKGDGYR